MESEDGRLLDGPENENPESVIEGDNIAEESKETFLLETVRRSRLLSELRSSPMTASELANTVAVSRSTIHRATNSLSELNLIEKSNGEFTLTGFGEVVATEVDSFRTRMEATKALQPLFNLVNIRGIPVEHFADAEVIQPKPRQPHFSVRRIMELIEQTDRLRVFSTVISPFYVDVAHREMLKGMEAEVIFDERIIDIIIDEYWEQTSEVLEAGRFQVYIHGNLPFELFLFDDRIGIAAHDSNGIARVFIESDNREAIDWGERLYDDYLNESNPVSGIDE